MRKEVGKEAVRQVGKEVSRSLGRSGWEAGEIGGLGRGAEVGSLQRLGRPGQ